MKILLICADYPPEIRSVAMMCKELAEELSSRGHKVTVLTSWPRYNLPDGIKPEHFKGDSLEAGVRVLRVKTLPLHNNNYILRGLSQLTLPLLFFRTFKKKIHEKIDAVIVYSPPLPLASVGERIKRRYNAFFLLNVQDIFPKNAIDLGILRNVFFIRYFERMEVRAYRAADIITTCTQSARQFLMQNKRVNAAKVVAIYNWIDLKLYENAKPNGFRKQYGIEGKFIILFAGIIGPSQGLEYIIEVARSLSDVSEIVFLLVGNGTSRPGLENRVRHYGLTNVRFGEFVEPVLYPSLLKEADVGLMTLEKNCKTVTIPGKFFGFAGVALPVLGFLNKESEGHHIMREAQCGYSMIPGDVQAGAQLVRHLYKSRTMLSKLGENGRSYVAQHFSKSSCIDSVEKLIRNGSSATNKK